MADNKRVIAIFLTILIGINSLFFSPISESVFSQESGNFTCENKLSNKKNYTSLEDEHRGDLYEKTLEENKEFIDLSVLDNKKNISYNSDYLNHNVENDNSEKDTFSYVNLNNDKKNLNDEFIKSVKIDREKINLYETFSLSIEFSAIDSENLKESYEYELSENNEILITGSTGYIQKVAINKDGINYGYATLVDNKLRIDFNKENFKEHEEISGKISFSAMVKWKNDNIREPGKTIVENIAVGDTKTKINISTSANSSNKVRERKEVPFFKTGRITDDGKIEWGLVFNQNIDIVNNYVCINHPVEVYDDTGEQMRLLKDSSNFKLSIHNDDLLKPDLSEMEKNGTLETFMTYYNYMINSENPISEVEKYMYVPKIVDESKYPTKIWFEEKYDGQDKYLSIVANYSRDFSGNWRFSYGDVEIGRVYFNIPNGVLSIDDFLKAISYRCNENGIDFIDNAKMYVIIYPGFIEGKYITFSYKTQIVSKHKKDSGYVNLASVNYIDKGISFKKDDGSENIYRSEVVNYNSSASIDFKTRINHCRIYNYDKNSESQLGIGESIFEIYDSHEEAVLGNEKNALYRVETDLNGYTDEIELKIGKEYFIRQVKVNDNYKLESSIRKFKMKNKGDSGNIYYFLNEPRNILLPQTGGSRNFNYIATGLVIQILFVLIKLKFVYK